MVFMSSHILTHIEALCDNVAILGKGRLAAIGNLLELLTKSGENQTFAIKAKGASAESLNAELGIISGTTLTAKPNGANIQVLSEDGIEKVLPLIKKNERKTRFRPDC